MQEKVKVYLLGPLSVNGPRTSLQKQYLRSENIGKLRTFQKINTELLNKRM